MINHIVLLKPKADATDEQLEQLCSRAAMLAAIPGVLSVKAGKNNALNSKYTYFLHVELKDKMALDAYFKHPSHEEFASRYLRPIREDTIVLDF